MFLWAKLAVFNIPGHMRLERLHRQVDEADREE